MAYFTYDVIYQGKSCTTDLSQEVVLAIEESRRSKGLRLDDSHRPEYVACYKYFLEGRLVLLGVLNSVKIDTTEEVRLTLKGTESDNLRAKSDLLKKIDGLELE
jgi:hypothetical protein